MKVLLIVAMESELQGFLTKLETEVSLINGIKVYRAKVNNVDLFLAKSEVGKVNSACLTTALCLKIKPRYVINAGIAGGLNPSVNLVDVVASSKIMYHDFDLTAFGVKKGVMDGHDGVFKGSKKLLSLLDNDVKKGLLVSGDQFVSGVDALNEIKTHFPKALACDMEGCSIAHASSLLSRKFLVIRAISDNVYLENHTKVYQDYKPLAIEKISNVVIKLLNDL